MSEALRYLWLIPVLPLAGFVVNGLLGLALRRAKPDRRPDRRLVAVIACGTVLAAFVLSLLAVLALAQLPAEHRTVEQTLFHWIQGGDFATTSYHGASGTVKFTVEWAYLLDPLSSVMILVVCGVGFLIHLFAVGYMWDDTGFYRFFAYLNLFMFSMLTLVLGNNYLMMFLGWEGVGFCSYALIGFYFHKRSASDAGKKAFVVNRIGDFGFTLGVMLIFVTFGSFNFSDVAQAVQGIGPEAGFGLITVITLLLFVGACGKSAQIPLYVWLPDAMEGPTPVSALIHAATMVTAGVYMVTRSNFLFTRAPLSLEMVAFVGITTALFAAALALFQRDIKKVLAYSTISQLGYMFAGLGVGAFSAGVLHLTTHAFFKALLFLGAGSVIHAMHHEQDLQNMGNLRKYLPVTFATMTAAWLAICGIPPFSGFFSKDEILWQAFATGHHLFYGIGLLAAGMTAFYMTRLMVLAFFSEERIDPHVKKHLHESPRVMTAPLAILAFLSVVGGLVGLPAWLGGSRFERWLEPVFEHAVKPTAAAHHGAALEIGLAALSVGMALLGMALAWRIYRVRKVTPDREADWGRFRRILFDKLYVDELYEALFVRRCKNLGNALSAVDQKVVDGAVNGAAAVTRGASFASGLFDRYVVDALVNLQGWVVQKSSAGLRRVQTGVTSNYALAMVLGAALLACLYFLR